MINLINMIISFFIGFTPIGLILPVGIMKFFKKDNSQSLPEAYQGVRDGNKNKDEYIKQKVDQVSQSEVYDDEVNQVTYQAEDQWYNDNPYFREIQNLITDNDYCGLIGVYRRDGLTYPKAFWNSFNVFIKDHGDLNKGVYSINATIGEFIHDLIQEFGFDRYNSEVASMIDACKDLRDNYGILFNTEQQPSTDNTETTAVENEDGYVDKEVEEIAKYDPYDDSSDNDDYTPIDDDEDDDIIEMDSDDDDDDNDEQTPVDNTAKFYRTVLPSEENNDLLKEFDKAVSPTPTTRGEVIDIKEDVIEIISPVIETDDVVSSSPTKEKSEFNPYDKSTWNKKHHYNAKWCVESLPTCATCGGDREGDPPNKN